MKRKTTYTVSVYKDGTFGFSVNGGKTRKRKNLVDLFKRVENRVLGSTQIGRNVLQGNLKLIKMYEHGELYNSGTYSNPK